MAPTHGAKLHDVNVDLASASLKRPGVDLNTETLSTTGFNGVPGLYAPSKEDLKAAEPLKAKFAKIPFECGDETVQSLRAMPLETRRALLLELAFASNGAEQFCYGFRKELISALGDRQVAILAKALLESPQSTSGRRESALDILRSNDYAPRAAETIANLITSPETPQALKIKAAEVLSKCGAGKYAALIESVVTPAGDPKELAALLQSISSDNNNIDFPRLFTKVAVDNNFAPEARAAALNGLKYYELSASQAEKLSACIPAIVAQKTLVDPCIQVCCEARLFEGVPELLRQIKSGVIERPEHQALILDLAGRSKWPGMMSALEALWRDEAQPNSVRTAAAAKLPQNKEAKDHLALRSKLALSNPDACDDMELSELMKLPETGSETARSVLSAPAKHDWQTVLHALQILQDGKAPPYEVRDSALNAMRENHDFNSFSYSARYLTGALSVQMFQRLAEEQPNQVESVLHAATSEHLSALFALKKNPRFAKSTELAIALIRLGDQETLSEFDGEIRPLLKAYDHQSLAKALALSPSPDSVPMLLRGLRSDDLEERRRYASACAELWEDAAARLSLISKLLTSKETISTPEGSYTAIQFGQALQKCIDLKIEKPFRFEPETVINATRSRSEGLDPKKPHKTVIIIGRADEAGAFNAIGRELRNWEKHGHELLIFEADNVSELIAAGQMAKQILNGQKVQVFSIMGHGSHDAIALNAPDPALSKARQLAAEGMLGFKDAERLQASGIFEIIDPKNGKVPLFACSTAGRFDSDELDMRKMIESLVPEGVEVLAPSLPALANKDSRAIFAKDGALIDFKFKTEAGGRRVR